MSGPEPTHISVAKYYGTVLTNSNDLKTNACCTGERPHPRIKDAINRCHPEVVAKYYGCGIVVPDDVTGIKVLDLGSGSGRDCYILSQLVGASGEVVGVDMSEEQVATAAAHLKYHADAFGYGNVSFKRGVIEDLKAVGLADNTFDLIISNCVINLCPDKEAVIREAFRVLKDGGEMYFSDVYANRRVPEALRKHEIMWNECISGALYTNDFIDIAMRAGFTQPKVVKSSPITIQNKELEELAGHIKFTSITYRLFKISGMETQCEDYGQAVVYRGTIPETPLSFTLDNAHVFEKGRVGLVCGNTWNLLHKSRYHRHFDFIGNFDTHFGQFDCSVPSSSAGASSGSGSCGC